MSPPDIASTQNSKVFLKFADTRSKEDPQDQPKAPSLKKRKTMSQADDDFLKELKLTFLDELDDVLEQIEASFLSYERAPEDLATMHEIFRYFHNVKGSSKTVGLNDLSHFAHQAENLLSKLRSGEMTSTPDMNDALLKTSDLMRAYAESVRSGTEDASALTAHARTLSSFLEGAVSKPIETPPALAELPADPNLDQTPEDFNTQIETQGFGMFEENLTPQAKQEKAAETQEHKVSTQPKKAVTDEQIKIPLSRIDSLLDLFGEQVILQSALDTAVNLPEIDFENLKKNVAALKKITQDLQHTMVSLRMVSLGTLFARMDRAIRDVAKQTGKKVDFIKMGQEAELDKTIVDALVDPLTHMVRNAVDHGIESPDKRTQLEKPEMGSIRLTAARAGGSFEIILEDDGAGLSRSKLIAKAQKQGLLTGDGSQLTDAQVYDFIFEGGFSTVEKATDISGRGVGMDVVRQQLRLLKGVCLIESKEGVGTRFIIRLPLSLAMFNGTIVQVNKDRYVIPNSDFAEALSIDRHLVEAEAGGSKNSILRVNDRLLKMIDLRETFATTGPKDKETSAPPADSNGKYLAIVANQGEDEYALLVSNILSQEQIVLKQLGPEMRQVRGASGGTILGDGSVALVLDINNLINRLKRSEGKRAA